MDKFPYAGDVENLDRATCLQTVLADCAELLADHQDVGLHLQATLPRMTELALDTHQGRLVCHAPAANCRVTIYFNGFRPGRTIVPSGINAVMGTCKDSRRRGLCAHTLAAIKQLQSVLSNRQHRLREQLFQLGQSEAWRNAITLLDQFAAAAPAPAQRAAPTESRVIWRVTYSGPENHQSGGAVRLDVLPYQQSLKASGKGWTKGKRLSIDAFSRLDEASLHQADRRLLDAIHKKRRTDYWYYGNAPFDPVELLGHLVGHPLVFWDEQNPQAIDILQGEFGLLVREQPEGWRILASIDGMPPERKLIWQQDEGGYKNPCYIDKDQNRIVVAKSDKATCGLAVRLMSIADPIPPEGQPLILASLARLQDRLPVVLPESLQGGTIAADERLYLRLTPQSTGGMFAQLVVIPAQQRPPTEPGTGPALTLGMHDGKQVRIERQLSEERRRAAELAEALRLTDSPPVAGSRFSWLLPADDDALDLLARLTDLGREDVIVQWPQGGQRTISREISPQALRVRIDDRKDWFGISGSIEIEGQQVELARILAATRRGQRYVELGPGQFVRLAQALRSSLEAIDDVTHETKSGHLELDATAAPVLEKLCDPGVELQACAAWQESLTRLQGAEELRPDPPITLAAELRDYQLDGYRWLRRLAAWGMGGCLADDMGLGKTVQALAVMIDRMEEGPALVVAPTSVGFNWVRETQRFAPTLRPVLYHETDREEVLSNLSEGDVLVVSYGLLLRDVEKLAKVSWGTLVLDEAQKIKNSATKSAQAVRQIDAKWRLALTGTPLENHLGELWSIFRATCPGLLGSWDRFRTKFAEPIERQKDGSRRRALARLMRPFILRRTKSEVLEELPDRTEMVRTAELSADERQRYEAARLAALLDLASPDDSESSGGDDRRFQVLAALTRLRQLACHPRLVDAEWTGGSAKLEAMMDIVQELRESGHRALVFSQFTSHLALIREALDTAGIEYLYLDGQTPPKERERRVDAFQRGEGELFLISLKAGGTGLNLTAADYVIHMDPWWNPAVEDQATDRAHRIGQTRPVTVYRLVAKDTIEEQILALHADKRHLVADVLEGTDQAGKLSTKELISLIKSGGAAEEAAQVA